MIRKHVIVLAFSGDDHKGIDGIKVFNFTQTAQTLEILKIIPKTGEWLHLHQDDVDILPGITEYGFFEVGLITHFANHVTLTTTIHLKPL